MVILDSVMSSISDCEKNNKKSFFWHKKDLDVCQGTGWLKVANTSEPSLYSTIQI